MDQEQKKKKKIWIQSMKHFKNKLSCFLSLFLLLLCSRLKTESDFFWNLNLKKVSTEVKLPLQWLPKKSFVLS